MISTAHTLISLPFGLYFNDHLWVIFILSFLWHFVMDMLPHWNLYPEDYHRSHMLFYAMAALDVISGVFFARLIYGPIAFSIPMLVAILGGNMPDILHTIYDNYWGRKQKWLTWAKPFFDYHEKIQCELKSMWLGIISQVIMVAITSWLMA